jgi:hypothetical protein
MPADFLEGAIFLSVLETSDSTVSIHYTAIFFCLPQASSYFMDANIAEPLLNQLIQGSGHFFLVLPSADSMDSAIMSSLSNQLTPWMQL